MKYNPPDRVPYETTAGDSPTYPRYLVTVGPLTARVTPIGSIRAVLTDIAIDSMTGIMYAVSGFNQRFYTVNLDTGLATQIGSTALGFQNRGGLGANSKGALYGVDNFSTYTYNKTTGGDGRGANSAPESGEGGGLRPELGLLWAGRSDNLHLRFLVTISLTRGLGVEVAPILINDLDAMAFVPDRK